ncbi:MAG: SdpI family protein [Eubacteriales bacterium]|nr:SdpI family protein [Eubacteriales bacterium]
MSTIPTEILSTAATEPSLDIESIKSLMDGFDPAALLPDLSELFGSLATLCRFAVMIGPVVLLILGLAYLLLSPREANYYFGYRCYFGMGSVQAWRFTQRMAGLLFGGVGLILTIVMYVISGDFAGMEVTDMVWKAAGCLAWQAVIALILTMLVNFLAFFFFDAKGGPRRKKKKEQ